MELIKTCEQCGKEYVVRSNRRYSVARFCSRKCSAHWRLDNKDVSMGGIITSTCAFCGKDFNHWRHEPKKFCGNKCKFAYQKIHPTNDHGKKKSKPCTVCGKEFFYWPAVRPDAQYCCYACKASDHGRKVSGIKSGNWKGNERSKVSARSLARRYLPAKCAICGWEEAHCDSHHIVLAKDNGLNALSNIIILCPNHHRLVHTGLLSPDDLIIAWHKAYDHLQLDQSLIS